MRRLVALDVGIVSAREGTEMATVTRRANAVWTGRLVEGGGKVAVGSGAFPPLDYELTGRADSASAQTSP